MCICRSVLCSGSGCKKPEGAYGKMVERTKRLSGLAICFWGLALLPAYLSAAVLALDSEAQGWAVRFEAPVFDYKEMTSSEIRYRFFGRTNSGLFLSLHVEPNMASERMGSCMDKYVALHDRLPDIVDRQTIIITDGDIQTVNYFARIDFKGDEYMMPNTHYYFPIKGYCADLHLGATPVYDKQNRKSFERLAEEVKKSLTINTSL